MEAKIVPTNACFSTVDWPEERKNNVLASREVPLRMFDSRSVVLVSEPLSSLTSTTNRRNLYCEDLIKILRALISDFNLLSCNELLFASSVKLKKAMRVDGRRN